MQAKRVTPLAVRCNDLLGVDCRNSEVNLDGIARLLYFYDHGLTLLDDPKNYGSRSFCGGAHDVPFPW